MTSLLAIGGIVLIVALVWKLYQLWRAPYDLALRAITLWLLLSALSYPMQLHYEPVESAINGALGEGMSRLIQNLMMLAAFYLIMAAFLFSAGHTWRRARLEMIPLLAAMIAMTASMFATPVDQRSHEFATTDLSTTPIALFYLSGLVYFGYSLGNASRWAWQYANEANPIDRHLATGLRLASIGLIVVVTTLVARIVYIFIRVSGGTVPTIVSGISIDVLAVGIMLLLIGVSYPGARTRFLALRRWVRHRRCYDQLRPLWTLLHDAYPADELHRVPTGPLRDMFALRQVHRRYYRRVIECRDGLVKISPYLAHTGANGSSSPREQAGALREALNMQARGDRVDDSPMRVAAPAGPGLDADVNELVQLSQALRNP